MNFKFYMFLMLKLIRDFLFTEKMFVKLQNDTRDRFLKK